MATRKIPYLKLQNVGLFSVDNRWVPYKAAEGCIAIETQQRVSKDQLLPDELEKAKQAEKTTKTEQAKKAKEERKSTKASEEQTAKTATSKTDNPAKAAEKNKQTQPNAKEQDEERDSEPCEKPPVFDMLDIPSAMEKMKFPVAAKLARKWFNGEKHIYNDKPDSVQPMDIDTVTLSWVLKFKIARDKYKELIEEKVYSPEALNRIKSLTHKYVHTMFIDEMGTPTDIDTAKLMNADILSFHNAFQFQRVDVSLDSVDGLVGLLGLTDLTASLGNFALMAGVADARINCERYYKSLGGGQVFCCTSKVTITHIYVYVKDNYSFNDKKGKTSSQYLGHWNHRGAILVFAGLMSDALNRLKIDVELGNDTAQDFSQYRYLPLPSDEHGLDKPVDIRKGWFNKFRHEDVYYPIRNRDYNEWRQQHNRGGDFMIYSKPEKIKLAKPIEFKLDEICRPQQS